MQEIATSIARIIDVRETSVSRHHRGSIKCLRETPGTSQSTIVLRGLRGALNWSPTMARDTPASRTADVSSFSSVSNVLTT